MDETYLCNVEEVKDNCPSMCGECCMDDNEYTFGVDGVTRDCNWLSQQILAHSPRHWWEENMCNELLNGKKVRDGCTKSCRACGSPPIETLPPSKDPTSNPTASPSSAPTASPSVAPTENPSSTPSTTPSTTSPTPSPSNDPSSPPSSTPSNKPTEFHCHNNDSFRHNEFEKKSCKWIRFKAQRRATYCQDAEVLFNCPITCGECCEDNSHYSFEVNNKQVKCDWLTPQRAEDYCDKWLGKKGDEKMVRDGCPKACDYCEGPPNMPSASPSSSPTASPSSAPTASPSVAPIENPSSTPTTTPSTTSPTPSPSNDPSAAPSSTPSNKPTEFHCHNNDSFRHNDNEKMSCKWIRFKDQRRATYCQDAEVLFNCPITCGECCEDNSHYSFEVSEV